jgi:hypothetical protein
MREKIRKIDPFRMLIFGTLFFFIFSSLPFPHHTNSTPVHSFKGKAHGGVTVTPKTGVVDF